MLLWDAHTTVRRAPKHGLHAATQQTWHHETATSPGNLRRAHNQKQHIKHSTSCLPAPQHKRQQPLPPLHCTPHGQQAPAHSAATALLWDAHAPTHKALKHVLHAATQQTWHHTTAVSPAISGKQTTKNLKSNTANAAHRPHSVSARRLLPSTILRMASWRQHTRSLLSIMQRKPSKLAGNHTTDNMVCPARCLVTTHTADQQAAYRSNNISASLPLPSTVLRMAGRRQHTQQRQRSSSCGW